ncbi:MAG: GNAT family N-acetyltransferase [Actinomycetota bacterium]|nr:GNAT family N-acetyltransferase [Actinomycetota bacterium]
MPLVNTPSLPCGLTARTLTMDDARAVFEVAALQEQHDLGKVEIEAADIVADWQRPSFDVGSQTIGVFDGETMVGYGEITSHDRGDAAVHPSYRRRGLGSTIARWMQDCARGRGATVLGTPVPEGSPGDRLLEKLGYRVRWTSWVLALPEGREIQKRTLPDGYAIRQAKPVEYPAVHDVKEDAFLEWSVREREPFDDFLATTVNRPGFEPWNLRVVADASGQIVGIALVVMSGDPAVEAFIDRLAVRRDQRRRGLGQALLVDAFARGREHGATRAALSTDSRTGALSLYRKVGMEVTDVWVNRAVHL